MSRTPWVFRPISEISETLVRMTIPPRVMSITSSDGTTSSAATTRPFRSVAWIEMIPFPPRPVIRYSEMGERLPYPFPVATRSEASLHGDHADHRVILLQGHA